MHNALRIFIYILLSGLFICTALDILAQPLLWPLAGATLLMLGLELYAYEFPLLWYFYSHPRIKRRNRH